MDNQVIVSDYTQMDRVLREERAYILDIVKKIKKAGCNVLLIQKSILRLVFNAVWLWLIPEVVSLLLDNGYVVVQWLAHLPAVQVVMNSIPSAGKFYKFTWASRLTQPKLGTMKPSWEEKLG